VILAYAPDGNSVAGEIQIDIRPALKYHADQAIGWFFVQRNHVTRAPAKGDTDATFQGPG
jgi:hypothetical protein